MNLSSAYLFGRQIRAGEVPVKIYYRYTPVGIGYIDGVVAYVDSGTSFTKTSHESARGWGYSNIQSASNDLILSELTEKTYAEYQTEEKIPSQYYGDEVLLLDIPAYDEYSHETSPYHFIVTYKMMNTPAGYVIIPCVCLCFNNDRVTSQYVSGMVPAAQAANATNTHYYIYAGAGRLWGSSGADAVEDDNLYVGVVVYSEHSSTGDIYVSNNHGVLNYNKMKSSYNIYISDEYFKGNNDNPDYPIIT